MKKLKNESVEPLTFTDTQKWYNYLLIRWKHKQIQRTNIKPQSTMGPLPKWTEIT